MHNNVWYDAGDVLLYRTTDGESSLPKLLLVKEIVVLGTEVFFLGKELTSVSFQYHINAFQGIIFPS